MPEKGVFPNLKDYSLIPNRDVRALLDRIDRTSSIEGSFHAYKLSTILARDLGWYMKLERIDFISLYDRVRTLGIIRFETEQIGKRVSYLATPDATRAFAVLAFVAKKESKNGRIARKAHNWPDIVEKTRAALGPHPLADLIYDPKPEPKRKGVVQTHDTAKVPKIRKKPGNEDDPWNYIDDKTNRMIPVFSEEEREELARWTPKIIAEGLASYRFRHFPSETVSAEDVPISVQKAVLFIHQFATRNLQSNHRSEPDDITYENIVKAFNTVLLYYTRYKKSIPNFTLLELFNIVEKKVRKK